MPEREAPTLLFASRVAATVCAVRDSFLCSTPLCVNALTFKLLFSRIAWQGSKQTVRSKSEFVGRAARLLQSAFQDIAWISGCDHGLGDRRRHGSWYPKPCSGNSRASWTQQDIGFTVQCSVVCSVIIYSYVRVHNRVKNVRLESAFWGRNNSPNNLLIEFTAKCL